MRMYDIIHKKRQGGELTHEEIAWLVKSVTGGSVPDYQVSALLMAIFFRGMTPEETVDLTWEMARSGDMADLSPIPGVKVDKHSTGGVGDKTSLIVGPIAAACGVKIAKMSGRGLGHTGGTVDKLESIPGLHMDVPRERFYEIVNKTGIALVGQSGSLCPADKKLYALRDVTNTVDSLPLIAASIMSKKLAAGADAILLDVKLGSGAFMKTLPEAVELAELMVDTGNRAGRRTAAMITDMDMPLGRCIGNALEVREAVEILRGDGDSRLTELSLELAAGMITLAGLAPDNSSALAKARETVASGSAFKTLCDMVSAQGGDASCLEDTSKLPLSPWELTVSAPESGYITALDAETCGLAAMELGAGRESKDDEIDYGAGIVLLANKGAAVESGQPIAKLYAQSEAQCAQAKERFLCAITIEKKRPDVQPLIIKRIGI
ncbi:MAG: pyrimidine-nucleoside phosphorylase [Acutalibacter sp.]|jgi:pyrimidine-nucleoside phosphorylase|uniref:pyrimidine-nucleoside phosphorylase n=1 Tax=Acutalibacter sp. TaxID=1918636 RepID=UPI002174A03E|nr:pyrimidine-nucleoside phosphorylase [Acutalibacter sp.]MCI9224057.1 pyrimidine-nucleoside phosphorylase [Acutalibacter sp.]